MAFKVQVGPPQIAIHQGQTVLVTDPDGTITWPSEKGLYFLDTRIISNWAIYGTVRPRAFAVLRLMTSSYLVGACTGRSAGFSPFRMRSI